jgi:periplasmic protein TonB
MATCDHPSDLVHRSACLPLERAGVQTDSRLPGFLWERENRPSASTRLQGIEAGEVFHSLIATGDFRPRNPWTTVGSLAIELLLVLTAVAIPFFHTDPLPKRETVTKLYLQPPPAVGGNAARLQAPRPRSTYTATSIAIPTPLHKIQEAPPAAVATSSEVVAGIPGGVVSGVPGGVLSEAAGTGRSMPVLAKPPEPAPVKRIRVASRVAEANLIHDVPPQYPPEAGRERIEGTVVLMAVIGKDGSVLDVQVESGLPLLAQAAMEAVKQWRYKPYLSNGEPVEIDSRITINFTISKG